jgi:hypothetical protein
MRTDRHGEVKRRTFCSLFANKTKNEIHREQIRSTYEMKILYFRVTFTCSLFRVHKKFRSLELHLLSTAYSGAKDCSMLTTAQDVTF